MIERLSADLRLARHASALRATLAPGTQRVGPLVELPPLLRELGARPSAVLRRAGLAADALSDREGRVAYARSVELLAASAEATRCPHFGLLLGSRWRLDHLGLVGEATRCCPTVGQALETFTAYQWLNSSGGSTFLRRDRATTRLGYAVYEPGLGPGLDQVCDMVVAIAVRLLRELTGDPSFVPPHALLSRRRPRDVAPWRKLLGPSVQFDADATFVRFPTALESRRVPTGDETRRRALEARLAAAGRESLLPRLKRMIRVAMVFGLTSGDEVAAAMALSRRTFNRRLANAGTTFHRVLEDVRLDVSRQLLLGTSLSVADVGSALGYAEPSTFVRAFRRWSGTTPGAWREAATRRAAD